MQMNKIFAMLLVSILFISLGVAIKSVAGGTTVVKVDPSVIEYYQDATGQQFTVAIKIVDVTNLYGFDIKFRWNTTFLDYVSHSVHVPKDTYSDGVLWNPIITVKDEIDTDAGTYWIAYTSRWPAPSFNGSGTVFTMTFRVKHHPVQPEPTANLTLELYSTDLSDKGAYPIPHTKQNGTVILHALSAYHDIAVIDVKSWKTVVGQSFTCKINVTVQNHGNFTETFNVKVYADLNVPPIGDEITIGTQRVVSLLSGETRTFAIMWNTTAATPKGIYTISAVVDTVLGEADTADNTFIDSTVQVAMVGDLTGPLGVPDGRVDIRDVATVAKLFGVEYPDPRYNPNCDINSDLKIDIKDIAIVAKQFGKIDP